MQREQRRLDQQTNRQQTQRHPGNRLRSQRTGQADQVQGAVGGIQQGHSEQEHQRTEQTDGQIAQRRLERGPATAQRGQRDRRQRQQFQRDIQIEHITRQQQCMQRRQKQQPQGPEAAAQIGVCEITHRVDPCGQGHQCAHQQQRGTNTGQTSTLVITPRPPRWR